MVIVGTANSYEVAEKGAVTAALSLSDQSKAMLEGRLPSRHDKPGHRGRGPSKCLALAVHELVGRLPVTMRSRNNYGVRCEDGEVLDTNYTGPVLEESLKRPWWSGRYSPSGPYRGIPVVVVPIIRKKEAVAVFGIVDITKGGMFEMVSRAPQGPTRSPSLLEPEEKERF